MTKLIDAIQVSCVERVAMRSPYFTVPSIDMELTPDFQVGKRLSLSITWQNYVVVETERYSLDSAKQRLVNQVKLALYHDLLDLLDKLSVAVYNHDFETAKSIITGIETEVAR